MYRFQNLRVLEMRTKRIAEAGFTLIEVMVTVAVVAVLMAVAVPSFTTYQRNAELTSVTNTLLAAINAARGEAMKRGMYSKVVPKDGVNWSTGWIVFVDVDRDGLYAVASDTTILLKEAPPAYLTISGTDGTTSGGAPYIMYDPSGYSRATSGFATSTFEIQRNDVSGAEQLAQTRRVKIVPSGRTRVCTPKTSTDSLCSSTGT